MSTSTYLSIYLIPQSQDLLLGVHAEPDEPDLAVLVVELVHDGHLGLARLDLLGVEVARLPADDRVLARLGQDEVAEPPAAVDVVAMDVARGKVGKVDELRRERLLRLHRVVGVGQGDRRLDAVRVELPQLERVVHPAGHDVVAAHVEVG